MPDEPRWRRYRRFWGADPERDVEDELGFHLSMRADDYRREGHSPEEAEALARERFGDVSDVRDECRDLSAKRAARRNRASWRDALRQDVRYAIRSLASSRAFAAAVVGTMALAIGASSAVFSVAYGVLLRPLVYRDADALVRLWSRRADRGLEFFSVSPADYKEWKAQNRVFTTMGAFERQREGVLSLPDGPETIQIGAAEPGLFALLGTLPSLGRPLAESDAAAGAPAVVMIAHELWATRFAADSSLVGQPISIDGRAYTVAGVMPPRFFLPGSPAEVWTPLSLASASPDHGNRYLRVLGRLAPGVPLDRARAELDVIADRLAREFPASNSGWTVNSMSVPENMVGTQFRRAVVVLLGVVVLVLLIACANSANLHLARGALREREIAVRAALGASRGRIVTQLLVESTLLAGAAGALGLLIAHWGVELLRTVGTTTVPRLEDVRLDAPVIGFTVLVAVVTGFLFGIAPGIRAARTDLVTALRRGARTATRRGAGEGIRSALVVVEVMLSLILLVGAGLLARSFVRLMDVDVGFDARGLMVAPLRLPEGSYASPPRIAAFHDALREQLAAVPGIAGVAVVSSAPFAGPNTGTVFARLDRPLPEQGATPDTDYRVAASGYFSLLGIPLVRGRDFGAEDSPTSPPVAVVSETVARRYWPNDDPLGARFRLGDIVNGPVFTIVGIVGDVRYYGLEAPELRPMMYFAASQSPQRTATVVVRTNDAATATAGLRRSLTSLDPTLASSNMRAMDDLLSTALATRRFALVLVGIFAGAAVLLAAVGIYGVMSYLVRQRTHEMGIRIALGASPRTLMTSVVWRSLRLTLAGVVLGLLAAVPLTGSLGALLFETSATDRVTFIAVVGLIVVVGLLAGLVPARRATKADPLEVLRAEG
jgi:predicted permease